MNTLPGMTYDANLRVVGNPNVQQACLLMVSFEEQSFTMQCLIYQILKTRVFYWHGIELSLLFYIFHVQL